MSGKPSSICLVTGAGRTNGIGYATASHLCSLGHHVVLTDLCRNSEEEELLEQMARQLGTRCEAAALDVCDNGAIEQVVSRVLETHKQIDVLFNNAGTPVGAGAFESLNDQAWQQSWDINVHGSVKLIRACLPAMKRQGSGVIINNASLAGLGAIAGMSAYTASKFAVIGLTKTLAIELGPHDIRVNAICPGMVWTDMGATEAQHNQAAGETLEATRARLAEDVPLSRWAEPVEVAQTVAFLASPAARYITGVTLPIAGGLAPGL